jgi:APA family basic amino acid/polyamine antiporter
MKRRVFMNIFKKKSLEQMLEGAHKTELKKNLKAKDIAAFGIGATSSR